MLDLAEVLQEFKLQKDKIERAISLLEALQQSTEALPEVQVDPVVPKRGRKHMGPEERQEVAARMRKYWSKRRKRKLQ